MTRKKLPDTWRGAIWAEAKAWGQAVGQLDRDFSKSAGQVASELLTGSDLTSRSGGKKTITIKIVK